jgi:hypothetical protein
MPEMVSSRQGKLFRTLLATMEEWLGEQYDRDGLIRSATLPEHMANAALEVLYTSEDTVTFVHDEDMADSEELWEEDKDGCNG